MTEKFLQVHFKTERKSEYYGEVTEIQYGANNIGAFMLITHHNDCRLQVAMHYLDDLYNVSDQNGDQTYYHNFN